MPIQVIVTELSMLIVGSALTNYSIEASDGRIGTVKTFLFDDTNWTIRWLVVDTGHWLTSRQVLLHPSAIGPADHQRRQLPVNLTKSQIEASPDIQQDEPVTMQMQNHLHSYYGTDPLWGGQGFYGAGLNGFALAGGVGMAAFGAERVPEPDRVQLGSEDGDQHLRSMLAVTGYHIHATNGAIGHVENFMMDDTTWTIRYLIVDTRNWWPGAHVLISPFAVQSIEWIDREIQLNVTQEQVKGSPPWNPAEVAEQVYERQLHRYYNWPGYGW